MPEGCPICDLGLADPNAPDHTCISYAEQASRVATVESERGLPMPATRERDQH